MTLLLSLQSKLLLLLRMFLHLLPQQGEAGAVEVAAV
jgi:hypothetical protein